MFDVIAATIVVVCIVGITAIITPRFAREIRTLIWLALVEFLASAVIQSVYGSFTSGGDMLYYANAGSMLATMLDRSFDIAAPELLNLLFQKKSLFDTVVDGAGANTGSMSAIVGFILFATRGSVYAAQAIVTGGSFFGALATFKALRDAHPGGSAKRFFAATVLFPSVAFWTSALHKEAFCLMGLGATLTAWRALYHRRWFSAIASGALGATLILIFRPPVLPPLFLGIGIHFAYERLRKARGPDAILLGPIYIAMAFALVAVGTILVSKVTPTLSLDQIRDTIATRDAAWDYHPGGSGITDTDPPPLTIGDQLLHLPLALVNSLFRPQLFDVHNVGTLVGAVEMSIVTWLVIRVSFRNGIRGLFTRVQRDPFLLMCAAITVVGCAFVGLATYNLGSLARYRTPFLPFYGVLVAILSERATAPQKAKVTAAKPLIARLRPNASLRRAALARRNVQR